MRRVLLCVALLAVFVCPAFAQKPGEGSGAGTFIQLPNGDWVPNNHPAAANKPPFPLHGWIDSPDWRLVGDYAPGFAISGWMLDCRDGKQPPFVAISVRTDDTRWLSYTVERNLSRPDVRDKYLPYCPAIGATDTFGYTLRVHDALPPGQHFLTLWWKSGDDKMRAESLMVFVK